MDSFCYIWSLPPSIQYSVSKQWDSGGLTVSLELPQELCRVIERGDAGLSLELLGLAAYQDCKSERVLTQRVLITWGGL